MNKLYKKQVVKFLKQVDLIYTMIYQEEKDFYEVEIFQ